MIHICKYEEDTKNYLTRFYEILEEMIKNMNGAQLTDSLSHNFIVQMIPHHMAAVEMSRNVLKYNPCRPLRSMAEDIVAMQEQGIREMTDALEPCCKLINSSQDLCLYQHRFEQITRNMFTEMNNACSDHIYRYGSYWLFPFYAHAHPMPVLRRWRQGVTFLI